MTRLLVLPRWGGDAATDWYEDFMEAAQATGQFDEVKFVPLPDPSLPVIGDCTRAFMQALGSDPIHRSQTIVVAHSVGAQIVLRALAADPHPAALRGVLAVAGWFRVDDVRATSAPWAQPIPNLAQAIQACGRLENLVSDNEPMIHDWWSNAWAWADAGAHVRVVTGAGHFMQEHQPDLLEALHGLVERTAAQKPPTAT